MDLAVEEILAIAREKSATGGIRLSNAWCVVLADRDSSYAALLNSSGSTYPDGAPVAAVMRRVPGAASAGRVRGPSLFVNTLDRGREHEIGHYFVGSTPHALDLLVSNARQRFPGLIVSGAWSPPFGPVTDELLSEMHTRIAEMAPDVVWVGMGSPKQDYVADNIARLTGIPTIGVGAAFDFVAGTVREAPRWMQRAGLEWAFRLASEPKRLWRRYLLGNAQFIWIVTSELIRKRDTVA
jgi:N-acetylglucosaminyldiphosphoundecaprenol N-acetyl-beta-D-mannosaminyltransferase